MTVAAVRTGRTLLMALAFGACASEPRPAADSSAATRAAAAAPRKQKGDFPVSNAVVWTSLIDPTLSQWRTWKSDTPPTGWRVVDGVLAKDGEVADIESRAQYANFELEFDWQLQPGGNSGVFYRVTEQYDAPYWSAPEYQLLDDAAYPAEKETQWAAAAYALYAPPKGVVKPAGEWNAARLVVAGNFVEHWLNGQQVVQYELRSADWSSKVKASKFAEYPAYGLASRGFLSIQGDHTGKLSIRGMRIRELP